MFRGSRYSQESKDTVKTSGFINLFAFSGVLPQIAFLQVFDPLSEIWIRFFFFYKILSFAKFTSGVLPPRKEIGKVTSPYWFPASQLKWVIVILVLLFPTETNHQCLMLRMHRLA